MVPPRLIRKTEKHSTEKLEIESVGRHQRRPLRAPYQSPSIRGGNGEKRGNKNEQRIGREIYIV